MRRRWTEDETRVVEARVHEFVTRTSTQYAIVRNLCLSLHGRTWDSVRNKLRRLAKAAVKRSDRSGQ